MWIDDAWASKQRDATGALVPDPLRWPNGMKAVADYVHSKGLLLGLYGDIGTRTCAGYPYAPLRLLLISYQNYHMFCLSS